MTGHIRQRVALADNRTPRAAWNDDHMTWDEIVGVRVDGDAAATGKHDQQYIDRAVDMCGIAWPVLRRSRLALSCALTMLQSGPS